jgi:hypothetical protein
LDQCAEALFGPLHTILGNQLLLPGEVKEQR